MRGTGPRTSAFNRQSTVLTTDGHGLTRIKAKAEIWKSEANPKSFAKSGACEFEGQPDKIIPSPTAVVAS
jgi:hypothetical protein